VRPMTDIVEDKKTGLVLPINDEKAWAEAIEHILENLQEAQKMGENGRKVLEERYVHEKMNRKILEMYDEVIKASRT